MKKNKLLMIFTSLVAILIYFTFSDFTFALLNLMGIEIELFPTSMKVVYLITTELLKAVLIVAIFYPSLKENLKDLKENHELYFKTYFKYWLIILAVMMVSNLIIMLLSGNETSGNEAAARDLMVKSPIYYYFSAVLYAPLVEELIFRKSIRNIFGKNWIFILVSGLVFGGLHVITGFSGPMDLLYLIPYCTPGFIFAYIMMKTDNVFVSASLHFMHNGLLTALQMFIYLFLS